MGSGGVSDLARTQEGAWWETGTVKCDVLRGIHLVHGQWTYIRNRQEVISSGVIKYN